MQYGKTPTKKLEFLGNSYIYPRMASQPMTERCLLTSELLKAKVAGQSMLLAGPMATVHRFSLFDDLANLVCS